MMNTKQAGPKVSSLLVLPAAAMMLCALPSFARDRDSDAAPAQQGGHYEARPEGSGDDEAEEAPAPVQQRPAARKRTVPRVFRPRPGGIYAEPNQDTASPGVVDGVILGGAGVSQGAADKKIGQGAGSASGSGGGGGSAGEGAKASGGPSGGGANGACSTPPPAGVKVAIVDTGDVSAYWRRQTFEPRPADIVAFKMTVPAGFIASGWIAATKTSSANRTKQLVLSTQPGCADTLGGQVQCRVRAYESAMLRWSTDSAVRSYKYYCKLTPGKTYYVNAFSQATPGDGPYDCTDAATCSFFASRSAPWGSNGGPLPAGGAANGGSTGNNPPPSAKNPPPSTRNPPRTPVPVGCQWSYKGFSPAPPAPAFACASSNAGQVVATGTDEYICTCR